MALDRQSSEFALGGRQESTLEPGFVRPPRDMKPPTPVDWGRGDSTVFMDTVTTPLNNNWAHPFSDAIQTFSPTTATPPTGMTAPVAGSKAAASGAPPASTPFLSVFGKPIQAIDSNKAAHQHHHQQHGVSPYGEPAAAQPGSAASGERAFAADSRAATDELLRQYRTPSQQQTDQLFECAMFYPPPPPILAPVEQRRGRAELWHYFANKWDITRVLPLPPRSPLPFMDDERVNRPDPQLAMTRYPYRGDYWLNRCEHWFQHVLSYFSFPATRVENQQVVRLDPAFIVAECNVSAVA